jgi:AraC-like DNA-binding protein
MTASVTKPALQPKTVSDVELTSDFVFFDSGCRRDSTVILRHQAIRQAILTMRERFVEPLTLQDLARAAQLSPFHFNRLFRSMTGLAPSVFLSALRLQQAKKLLLTTQRSVTEICFDVGYNSLGTFTSRFTQMVGIPPTRFRQFLDEPMLQARPQNLRSMLQDACSNLHTPSAHSITGTVEVAVPWQGIIFVGAFPDPLPQGEPVGCNILTRLGQYNLPPLPDGKHYLFAIAMGETQDLLDLLCHGPMLHGGGGKSPISVRNGIARGQNNLRLVCSNWADPPLLIALPWLLISRILQPQSALEACR